MTDTHSLTTRQQPAGGALRRLAVIHALNQAAEACFAVSLAGSLFFGVSVDAARPLIILYLSLTVAPFAVVLPMIGPVIDRLRGGQQWLIVASMLGRAAIFALLTIHLERLAFYPEAFASLVLARTYLVSKAAIVPRLEHRAVALVKANSRLSVAGAIGGAAGGATAATMLAIGDAPLVLWAGAGILVVAAGAAASLPTTPGAPAPPGDTTLVRSPFVQVAAAAVGAIRLGIGFMTFHLAFSLKQAGAPLWAFGVVLAAGAAGGFLGSLSAPALRRRAGEDRIIAIVLAVPVAVSAIAALRFHTVSALAVAASLGFATTAARHGFDSLVQREAPDVDRSRAFSRFETRFQLAWVLGALIPVVARPADWVGMMVLAILMGYAAGAYWWEIRALGRATAIEGRCGLSEELMHSARTLQLNGSRRQAIVIATTAAEMAVRLAAPTQEPADLQELRGLRDAIIQDSVHPSEGKVERAIGLATRVIGEVQPVQSPD